MWTHSREEGLASSERGRKTRPEEGWKTGPLTRLKRQEWKQPEAVPQNKDRRKQRQKAGGGKVRTITAAATEGANDGPF